jgi:predicted nucleic acid-binding protein
MLVDTSVWIDHFREGNMDLEYLLDEGRVAIHPFVIGELACGSLRRRSDTLRLFEALPSVPVATHDEVLTLIERHRLDGTGLGWIDMHLLASAKLAGQSLWSTDHRLRATAKRLGLDALE